MDPAPAQSAGSRIYSPLILSLYDWWVLWISNTYAWKCPTESTLLPLLRSTLGRRHLDIGVGTGYFLANTLKESPCKEITLLDLNPKTLAASQRRITSAVGSDVYVDAVIADASLPFPLPETRQFDSISLYYLLHCMPGPLEHKVAVFTSVRKHLALGGVLVGATILGREARRNWFAEGLMRLYNEKGIFDNWEDTKEGFEMALKKEFDEVEAWVIGRVLLFKARKLRS
jgi:SAM-dependent methyltransferase